MTREKRATFSGTYFNVTDAPNQPAPVQAKLPVLIGGAGEKRTLRLAARLADEWNSWTDPPTLAHKRGVLHQHCEDLGRDPKDIAISTQALMYLSNDEAWLKEKRTMGGIAGTPAEVTEIIGQYRDAGANEIIVPDFTMGSMQRRKDTCDLLMTEVASHFR
jgi:alkanesulfonate monooxygenase SsuD/methylene tetrahydromethanopterin reductase-like flavin-dependent oxidoreductase (luciferase family)